MLLYSPVNTIKQTWPPGEVKPVCFQTSCFYRCLTFLIKLYPLSVTGEMLLMSIVFGKGLCASTVHSSATLNVQRTWKMFWFLFLKYWKNEGFPTPNITVDPSVSNLMVLGISSWPKDTEGKSVILSRGWKLSFQCYSQFHCFPLNDSKAQGCHLSPHCSHWLQGIPLLQKRLKNYLC